MVDVLGLEADAALAVLEAAGWRVEVVDTRTPRPVELTGRRRVVRQRETGAGVVELVVTRERYAWRPGRQGG